MDEGSRQRPNTAMQVRETGISGQWSKNNFRRLTMREKVSNSFTGQVIATISFARPSGPYLRALPPPVYGVSLDFRGRCLETFFWPPLGGNYLESLIRFRERF